MAAPTGTTVTYDSVTNREELSDIIYNIDPMDTPFQSRMARRGSCDSVNPEWSIDSLEDPDGTNRQIEGDDATFADAVLPFRIKTFTQISDKTYIVSGTQEVVDKAGRRSEIAYLMGKNAKALKRDIETMLTGNFGKTSVDASARSTGSLRAWIHTNVDQTGSNAAFTDEDLDTGTGPTDNNATDGTQRAFLESQLKSVIRQAWTNGGEPTTIMVGPFNKVSISAFTGGSTRFDKSEDPTLYTSVDVYVSDFGRHVVVPNRFSRDRDAFVLDPKLWDICYLRGYRNYPLAKSGDNEKFQMITEYGLRSLNEAGSGVVADLTVS